MTAGNNGSATPEGDDPFAHLYRSEGGDGSPEGGPAAPRPGVPRTSYHQVRTVGSRQYGQQNQTYGGQQPPQQPAPHYAAPETLPGGTPRQPGPPPGGHGGGPQRPKRRGLLVAAIAVVVVVAGGIGAAMITNSGTGDAKTNADGDNKPDQQNSAKPKEPKKDEPSNSSAAGLQQRDAATLNLSGGATTEKTVKGAQADGGLYITGMNKVGAAVEWQVNVDADGEYRLDARYGVPGTDANLTITTNGAPESRPINMRNFGGTKDWENGWKSTWSLIQLKKGANSIKLSCEQGNSCDVHLDQLSIRKNG
ncbi:CBM35 domain-containing protein [Streptomyces sp. NPDC001407]|uniref:CBM35 domain-containing protein n=1 Tax=unclassified Streptomyces TaxID=2593676 RepID=UPI00340637CF